MLAYLRDVVDQKRFMKGKKTARLLRFLRQELEIPEADLRLALRHPEQTPNLLPMILWQYGLVTLNQLNQILDWLEESPIG